VFPFELAIGSESENYGVLARLTRLNKIYRLFKITKLLRSVRVMRNSAALSFVYDYLLISPKVENLVMYFFTIIVFCHLTGCLFYFASDLQDDSWIRKKA
jgi:hypothetical protein